MNEHNDEARYQHFYCDKCGYDYQYEAVEATAKCPKCGHEYTPDGEVRAYAFGTNFAPTKPSRRADKILGILQGTDGLIGVHPLPPRGSLMVYKTENDAKIARNRMGAAGVFVGEIRSCWVDARFVR